MAKGEERDPQPVTRHLMRGRHIDGCASTVDRCRTCGREHRGACREDFVLRQYGFFERSFERELELRR